MRVSRKVFFLACTSLIFVLYVVFGSYYTDKIAATSFNNFYNTNLTGKLSFISIKYKGVAIRVEKNPEQYVFYPFTDDNLNEGKHFHLFAELGDYVNKPANSDTLFLIKNSKTYKYTFKIDDKHK